MHIFIPSSRYSMNIFFVFKAILICCLLKYLISEFTFFIIENKGSSHIGMVILGVLNVELCLSNVHTPVQVTICRETSILTNILLIVGEEELLVLVHLSVDLTTNHLQ